MRCVLVFTLMVTVLAPPASAQVSPQSRVRKFWEIFSRADASGKALAFDVLDPADDPLVLKACFRVLDNPHPLVLAASVDFLTQTTGEKAVDALNSTGLGHRKDFVRLACARAWTDHRGQPRPLETVRALIEDGSWMVRWAAVEGLGKQRFKASFEEIAGRVKDEDPRVRVAAVAALRGINDLKFVDRVLLALDDPCWQVRSAAIDAVWKMRPRKAFGQLIRRLAEEKGRLRKEAHRVLVSLAGRDLGQDPEAWRDWWKVQVKRKGDSGRMDPEYSRYVIKPRKTVTRKFFGIMTDSKRIVFVLDISASMNRYAKPLRPMEGLGPDETTTRFDILKAELLFSLAEFGENDRFNLILFGTKVHAWKSGLVTATEKNRHDAISFLRSRPLSGETNLFDALVRAFGVSEKALGSGRGYLEGMTGGKKGEALETGPETIFLLSDGVPNRGAITDPGKIVSEITGANRVRRIVVHTIAVGRFHADFLRTLAKENWGRAVTVGEGGVR